MKAVTWQVKRNVSVDTVPDPIIEQPTDAIIKITSTNICGSDLHLYEVLGPFMDAGDILGHDPMGIVEEIWNGMTTRSPTFRSPVCPPTSSTMPIGSWPRMSPASMNGPRTS